MEITISPVSGGYFPAQVAAMLLMSEAGYEPKILGGSSGGNVAVYICHLGDFENDRVEKVLMEMNSRMFVRSWYESPLPSELMGFFKGSIYNMGDGGQAFLENFSNSKRIQNREIWTGTFNSTHGKAQFFCNRSHKTAILDNRCVDNKMLQCLDPIYCDGDIEIIAKVISASASIPALVPNQDINGETYEDGGLYYASPAAFMLEACRNGITRKLTVESSHITNITKTIKSTNTAKSSSTIRTTKITKSTKSPDEQELASTVEKSSPIRIRHIVYVNSFNIETSEPSKNSRNALGVSIDATGVLVKSLLVADRRECANFLFRNCETLGQTPKLITQDATLKNLTRYFETRDQWKASLLEIYPRRIFEVDITNFSGANVVKKVRDARSYLSMRIWYLD
jgi:predicted acylesterase/phospholipase RssA